MFCSSSGAHLYSLVWMYHSLCILLLMDFGHYKQCYKEPHCLSCVVELLCHTIHVCSASVPTLPMWLEQFIPQPTVYPYLCIHLLHQLLVFCFSHFSNCGRCSMPYIVALIHNLMIAFHFYWQARLSLIMCPFKFLPDVLFFLRQGLHYEVQASLEFNIISRILGYRQMPAY